MSIFSKRKGNPRVGPVLHSLYESIDASNRAAFKKFLSGAPSGCEIVATYKPGSAQIAQDILSAFQREGLPGPGVVGAEVFGDGFAIYLKGDFPEDAFTALTESLRQSGEAVGLTVEVVSGRFDSDHLKELP